MFTLVVYFKRMRNLWKSDCFINCRHWNVFEWLFKHDKRSEIILNFCCLTNKKMNLKKLSNQSIFMSIQILDLFK